MSLQEPIVEDNTIEVDSNPNHFSNYETTQHTPVAERVTSLHRPCCYLCSRSSCQN